MSAPAKSCDQCQHGRRQYADGYVYRDWSGCYTGDVAALPKVPDQTKFWTFLECAKNARKLLHLNLDGKCSAFQQDKSK